MRVSERLREPPEGLKTWPHLSETRNGVLKQNKLPHILPP